MLTEQEAFAAMRSFLAEFWKRGGSQSDSDLVDILSWTETLDDSGTYDPAQWHDWLAAVEAVRAGDRARPFEASRYQPLSLSLSPERKRLRRRRTAFRHVPFRVPQAPRSQQ